MVRSERARKKFRRERQEKAQKEKDQEAAPAPQAEVMQQQFPGRAFSPAESVRADALTTHCPPRSVLCAGGACFC